MVQSGHRGVRKVCRSNCLAGSHWLLITCPRTKAVLKSQAYPLSNLVLVKELSFATILVVI